jgi:hypothetical protein
MKLSFIIILLFVTILNGCDNPTDFDNGPCKFAPPESKFPIFRSCEECYFNIFLPGINLSLEVAVQVGDQKEIF